MKPHKSPVTAYFVCLFVWAIVITYMVHYVRYFCESRFFVFVFVVFGCDRFWVKHIALHNVGGPPPVKALTE